MGRETGLDFRYKKEKWEFTGKEQGEGSVDGKSVSSKVESGGKFLLNGPNKGLAEGEPG